MRCKSAQILWDLFLLFPAARRAAGSDLNKSCKMSVDFQKSASIQTRTSPTPRSYLLTSSTLLYFLIPCLSLKYKEKISGSLFRGLSLEVAAVADTQSTDTASRGTS